MKQAKLIIYKLLVSTLLSSCLVSNHAEGESGRCELHDKKFHKSLVRVKYGAYCAPGTHLGKGSETFPHAKHPICGGCSVRERYRWMYNCSKCNRARKRYVLRSMQNKERGNEIRATF